jgi:preprotein translocase subunit YajC
MTERITFLNTLLHLIAQAGPTSLPAGTQDPPFWASQTFMLYAVLAVAMIFVVASSGRANRQQEKRQKEMLNNLKRGDRVETIGGILGSVVEARETEVVLKVDESTNTKVRVIRGAIKKVTSEESDTQPK